MIRTLRYHGDISAVFSVFTWFVGQYDVNIGGEDLVTAFTVLYKV